MKRAVATLIAVAIASMAATAGADSPTASTAFPVDRLVPAIGPGLISVESAAVAPAGRVLFMATLGWLHQPLQINLMTASGSPLYSRPVNDAVTMFLGSEFGLGHSMAIDVLWPIVLYQNGDRLRGTGLDDTPLATTVAGDLTFRFKAAFAGKPEKPGLHLGLSVELTVPTGGDEHFAGVGKATGALVLHGDFRHTWFAIGAQLGYRLAAERQFLGTKFGDELSWGLGVVGVLWPGGRPRLSAVLEAAGVIGVSSTARPVELRAALRLAIGSVSIDVGAGGGLNDSVTAPKARFFVTLRGAIGRGGW